MFIDTTRFGEIEVDDTKIVTFTRGLLGFSQFKQYVLFQTSKDSYFYWLQSIETPDLAFVVTDPGVHGAGLLQPGLDSLRAAGVEHSLYSDTTADPAAQLVFHRGERIFLGENR